jgi:hypothetical protein
MKTLTRRQAITFIKMASRYASIRYEVAAKCIATSGLPLNADVWLMSYTSSANRVVYTLEERIK